MKERPILFKGEMVRAILDGRKTQTRRLVPDAIGTFWDHRGWRPEVCQQTGRVDWLSEDGRHRHCMASVRCKKGAVGDRLYVQETWATVSELNDVKPSEMAPGVPIYFRADDLKDYERQPDGRLIGKWRPSIFMPRWASRLTLEITAVRLERLNDISDADAIAEGIESSPGTYAGSRFWKNYGMGNYLGYLTPRDSYRTLWEQINGPGSWAKSPWVWVISFKRVP